MATLKSLLVRLTIPLRELIGASLMFDGCFPIGHENGVSYSKENCKLILWLDRDCLDLFSLQDATDEEIAKNVKLPASKIYVDTIVNNLDNALLDYMQARDFRRHPTPEEQTLYQRYEEHGRIVLSVVQDGLNHLLAFARTEKGQYWLRPYLIDFNNIMSFSAQCKAQARVDDGPWFRWQPSQSIYGGEIRLGVNPRYLTEADWLQASDFVSRGQKPNLVRELLAMAEFLEDSRQDRIALTEAVSALEIALNRFVKNPNIDGLFAISMKERIGVTSLDALVNRLGLLPSISILLPLLFPEEELPTEVLTSCREAVNERNNVVHKGQRQVAAARLRQYIKAIRTLCEILLKRTDSALGLKR